MKELYLGNCLEVLATLPENSVDTVITDPPYHLTSITKRFGAEGAAPAQFGTDGAFARASKGFMGKTWDGGDVAFRPETWAAVYRVLKPGGILLAMGGTRTFHRLVCAIEDAKFDVRDSIAWLYGSGFPKSFDISKGIDKQAGAQRKTEWYDRYRDGRTRQNLGTEHMQCNALAPIANGNEKSLPSTPAAQLWHGWGTALKPAMELICVAMKPIDGGFVHNALTWGVAGFWIDGGRVGYAKQESDNRIGTDFVSNGGDASNNANDNQVPNKHYVQMYKSAGRFPANVITDGSDEVTGLFPQTGGGSYSAPKARKRNNGLGLGTEDERYGSSEAPDNYGDSGSAARFFYCAKSSRSERNNGLDSYVTVKYNNDKSNNGGISWKDASTVAVQLLRRVISESVTLSFNIGESGESITVLCPKDSLSITLTAINKIIESKTLHSLTLSLTNDYTVDANCETVNGGSLVESVESLKKWILTTTNGHLELARGASSAALNMLLRIKNADAWSQATNIHSTVKPLALMRYLARLTKTPTGGVVLDPFMGSGTTGMAAVMEGRDFIGIELEPEYYEIAQKRIAHAELQPRLED